MNKMKKLYYHFTAYVPRKLPKNEAELIKIKDILIKVYGVKDEYSTYARFVGAITSTHGDSIRKSYGVIANNIKRVTINDLARSFVMSEHKKMEEKLAAATKKMAVDLAETGTDDEKAMAKEYLAGHETKAGLEAVNETPVTC